MTLKGPGLTLKMCKGLSTTSTLIGRLPSGNDSEKSEAKMVDILVQSFMVVSFSLLRGLFHVILTLTKKDQNF